MTLIRINGNDLNTQYNKKMTLNELLDQLLEAHLDREEVITGINIDGKTLNQDEENKCLPLSVESFNSIEFKAQSNLQLAFEALNSCSGYIDVVVDKIHELVALYQENQIEDANDKFSDVIEIVDLFVQLMTKINRTLKNKLPDDYKKSQSMQNLEIHLLSIMKGLLPAKENNDIIMLCDLLEYELIDNLTQWKIKAIPELKNLQKA